MPNRIFVFGSNAGGHHGLGAALCALQLHGAVYGIGEGREGNSYAIPTKDKRIKTLPLAPIAKSVDRFLKFAYDHPELEFDVTRIGCGLAGYTDKDIAPMFIGAPANCWFARAWEPWLGEKANYNNFV